MGVGRGAAPARPPAAARGPWSVDLHADYSNGQNIWHTVTMIHTAGRRKYEVLMYKLCMTSLQVTHVTHTYSNVLSKLMPPSFLIRW